MIQTRSLTKRFGDFVAVDRLDLDIPPGEIFSFLGPNGAGKTTTIRMLTGLLRPTRGTIRIGGIDLLDRPVEARRLMAYVSDYPFVYEKLSPDEFLGLVGDLYRVPSRTSRTRREILLEQFELLDVRYELLEHLSHGIRQRVVIAAALVHDPRIIIIDEPMVGLDPRSARIVKDILRSRRDTGATVFLSTHQLEVAEEIADRIGILHRGRLIARGTPAEIRRDVGNLETAFLDLTRE